MNNTIAFLCALAAAILTALGLSLFDDIQSNPAPAYILALTCVAWFAGALTHFMLSYQPTEE